ncbi:MAG: OmpA family protein [Bacteroidia bacterium]
MLILCVLLVACQGQREDELQRKINRLEAELSQEEHTSRRLQRYIDQQLGGSPAELTLPGPDSAVVASADSALVKEEDWSLIDSTLNATLASLKRALDGKLYMYKKAPNTDMLRLGGDMFFEPGEYVLSDKGKNTVAIIGEHLQRHPLLEIEVVGHTDDQPVLGKGPLRDNWDLSAMRATSVVRGLVAAGVPPQNIRATGRGPWQPIDRNDREAGRYLNRRTEIWVKRR